MTQPRKYLFRMIVFVIAVLAVSAALFVPLRDAFMANAPLNGLIVGVLVLGIIYNFRQVAMLYPEVAWIETFRHDTAPLSEARPPRLLAPMATMVGEHKDRLSLSTMAMRSLLDGIVSRLDESRDLSRYTIGLLIFLGLLGTFWGLLQTVASIGDVISGLSVEGGDMATVFGDLKRGLQAPMAGMGTAFSSSLFGLAGSLVLGFLDLQANQAQNRFYNELEDWLSTVTRLAMASSLSSVETDQSIPAYVQALLEQTAESLENLQRTLARGEESRISANSNLAVLGDKLETLTDHMRTEQALMKSLAETQIEMKPILAQLAAGTASGGIDDSTRGHIRNLDVHLTRLTTELGSGRDDLIQQLRSEIKLLARTIAATGDDDGR